MKTYFISDLHLSEDAPELTALFFDFLREHSVHMRALYVLGDFFDAWIGDDDDQPITKRVADALLELSIRGTKVLLMHGNRDFLLGADYAARCGAQLLPEVTAIGAGIAVCHGDHLCTQDLEYQKFRAQVRSRIWQTQFLAQPLLARRAFAAKARLQSKAHQQALVESIGDVDGDAVAEMFQTHSLRTIIHGHTHRPGVHEHAGLQRIVLGDWRSDQPSWLALDAQTAELIAHGQSWPISLSHPI